MGVLEDAIREHLELKRKHGVSDDEVRRQEDEALGPARNDTPAAEAGASVEAEPAAETALLDSDQVPAAPPDEPPMSESAPAGMAQEAPPEPEAVEEEPAMEAVEEAPVEETSVEDPPVIEPKSSRADFEEDGPEQDRLSFEERPRRDLDFD